MKRGRIPRNEDGTFDEAAVRKALKENTEPSRAKPLSAVDQRVNASTEITTEGEAREAVSLVRKILQEEGRGGDPDAPLTFDDARTADTIVKVRRGVIEMEVSNRTLIPKQAVVRHVEEAFAGYRKELQALPARYGAQIAAEVGCDVKALDRALSEIIREHLDGLSQPVVRA